ncbi:hypothetical protein M011DRAFT_462425 [Sporormia fimetaria CBS 119925]|uniref:MARVEL domain-containing protein n=1 Tax=Sporormia fimetaria CBS 119925 TaxID=1340428 RepID=A0A6A6UXQ0_9PLEO|nr:hypothetical protein M011DRAFT_462425 [Sporormia fimetaria CBS 119925]
MPRLPHAYSSPRSSTFLLPITFLAVVIWALLIAEIIISKNFPKDNPREQGGWGVHVLPSYWAFDDTGLAVAMLFIAAYALMAETIHLAVRHTMIAFGKPVHPVTTLVLAIFLCLAWLTQGIINTLFFWIHQLDAPDEDNNGPTDELAYTNCALSLVVALVYFGMIGFAAREVHAWRKAKKVAPAKQKAGLEGGGDEFVQ